GDATPDGETGGGPGDASDGGSETCLAIFASPTEGAKLTNANDADNDNYANGFQYDVVVNTSAADGTAVALLSGTTQLATANVAGGKVSFPKVQLDSNGTSKLTANVGNGACTANISVDVSCAVPKCSIAKPDHSQLNGVAVANGGDRASVSGSAYQVAFEVT